MSDLRTELSDAQTESLGAAEAIMTSIDPISLGRSLGDAVSAARRRPLATLRNGMKLASGLAQTALASAERVAGIDAKGPVEPEPGDKRFTDVAWKENPFFFGVQQSYLVARRFVLDTVATADLEQPKRAKSEFAARLATDALAPTNFLPTNPTALKRAFDTGGHSLVRGARNFLHDLQHNGGFPSQVDRSPFEVGRNMAATPGKVVYRNDLMELIQYEPVTEQVRQIPLLFSPPWINKYYIFDLAPGKSLIEWAVAHGQTCFAISYRNPDSSMRHVGFEDYLLKGPREAVDVIREITGADTVNVIAACLGGTLNTALLAYLQAQGESDLVNTSTYLNSLNDHAEGGLLGAVFTDERTVAGLARKMQKKGYLEAAEMARTFNLLRANDLVFSYVANNWLMGETPPAFDLLAWNNDSTRMPARMHAFYLRECWIENSLAQDRMELLGERLIVSDITNETYVLAAIDDHITPWRGQYRTTQLFKGESRFVLSSAGHIAGIVNPPSPKARLWLNDQLPPSADDWLAGAEQHQDTWWNDWARWIDEHSGDRVAPPALGSDVHPTIGDAPGSYVRG